METSRVDGVRPPEGHRTPRSDLPTVASPTTTTLHRSIKIVLWVVSIDLRQLSMGSGTSHFCSAGASSPFSSPTAAMLVCVGLPVDGARRAAELGWSARAIWCFPPPRLVRRWRLLGPAFDAPVWAAVKIGLVALPRARHYTLLVITRIRRSGLQRSCS